MTIEINSSSTPKASKSVAPRHTEQVIQDALYVYLSTLDLNNLPPIKQIGIKALTAINQEIEAENVIRAKDKTIPFRKRLTFTEAAHIMAYTQNICRIPLAGMEMDESKDVVHIYEKDGWKKGLYTSDEMPFQRLATELIYSLSSTDFEETMIALRTLCERKTKCEDSNLVAVNNGVFDRKTKTLLPFSSDYVFITKSMIDYDPKATNHVIHNAKDSTDWDIESWMNDLHDDPEVVDLLWKLIGACIRPNTPWNKCAFLFSETGNNGKGSLCSLIRNMCGPGNHASLSISDFAKEFMLEGLIGVSAVITDENDVGIFIDRTANLKAAITNDLLWINRKNKTAIPYRYQGFMIQCLNSMPRVKDRSESFYRRQLFIPMPKCFTDNERLYIKNKYLKDERVLKYVLKRVLHMDYEELPEPDTCKKALSDYKDFNDPVRTFWNETREEYKWDLLPSSFLYDLYKAWHREANPGGSPLSRNMFLNDLRQLLRDDIDWGWPDPNKAVRSCGRMDDHEQLIIKHELNNWYDPNARTDNPVKRANFPRAVSYRGPERLTPRPKTTTQKN